MRTDINFEKCYIGIEKIMTVEKKRFVVNVAKSLGEDILKME